MHVLKCFTWGYYGWGNAAPHFVKAVDILEEQRGFLRVVFVDLRIRRAVRAADFKEKAFEEIVGKARYRWMRRLGNQRIVTKTGAKIQIADPSAAEDLLDLIIDLHSKDQRVVMFCSCLAPLLDSGDGQPSCHRVVVADLLLQEARKRKLKLEVAEWPGEEPASLNLDITEKAMQSLVKSHQFDGDRYVRRYIKVEAMSSHPPTISGIGWGSIVELISPSSRQTIVTGPAYLQRGYWKLEVLEGPVSGEPAARQSARLSNRVLKSGYGPRRRARN